MAGMYDYESRSSDLTRRYNDEDAVSKYSRFISQQRFNRQRADMSQGFARQAPRFNASFAARGLGDSGIFKQGLGNRVNDYTQRYNDLVAAEGAQMGQFQAQDTNRQVGYRDALMRLMEQLQAQRAAENQFVGF